MQLCYQDIEDILIGCTIMGTGGGGSISDGLEAVKSAFRKGKIFEMLPLSEVNPQGIYINPYYCGSISPDDPNDSVENEELIMAIQGLEKYLDIIFEGVVSIEFGGGNTGQAMAAAAMLGKPIIDADAAGRAVPELQFSTYQITGHPISPFCVATKYGDVLIATKVASDVRAEALSRMMAVATDNLVGIADHPIKGSDLMEAVIPGALSLAGSVGRGRRKALECGSNPIEAILEKGNGLLIARGVVVDKGTDWKIENGFTTGEITIESENMSNYRIWYRNENMVLWKDDEVILTCPDLICVVDSSTGYPITNPNCVAGKDVTILAFESHPLWKTQKGRDLLNPHFFGFDSQEIVEFDKLSENLVIHE